MNWKLSFPVVDISKLVLKQRSRYEINMESAIILTLALSSSQGYKTWLIKIYFFILEDIHN